jgi:putative ATP-dependent endonuclease of the OLD family
MKIRRVDVQNFRGIKSASWRLSKDRGFIALIGPGDSTKTTILTAIERTLHDRPGLTFVDTDFYGTNVEEAIRIRVAVGDLPDELIAIDVFGALLSGIDDDGEWSHDPVDESDRCVIVELIVEADLEPIWQSYRPPQGDQDPEEDEPHPIRAAHRARLTAYRIDDRIDAHLRWSTTSSLGKLTAKRSDTKATLTAANRAAREAAASAVTGELRTLAQEVQQAVHDIGTAKFEDLKPGLDLSLSNTRGNLALFEGDVPLTNFGLGTRRLTGTTTQQLANGGLATLLVDEVEYGLEPHRLVHLLSHLKSKDAFSQVFVTTHSPTALRHLEPADLAMVRSTAGITEIRSLSDPPSLRPLLKRSPEAFLSRRIVINEGKTEYGVVLRLLQEWDDQPGLAVPSAALGVVALEGDGGTGSCAWARDFLSVGYEVVLFIDSDDPAANAMVPDVKELGGVVVQWPDNACIESAVCTHLDAPGLNAYIAAALDVADDQDASRQSFIDNLRRHAFADGVVPAGIDVLDLTSWTSSGIALDACRGAVAMVSKSKGWFKRVDRGQRLGSFILETPALTMGPLWAVLEQLRAAIYADTAAEAPARSTDTRRADADVGTPVTGAPDSSRPADG